jgi:hypothetical protein
MFQNSGLRLALHDLYAESHRHPMDLDAVTRWAQQLPPSSGRTWMLRWLVAEAPRVPAGQAHGELNRLTAELWKRALREHIEALKAELRQPGATLERKQQLIADLQRADQDLRAFSKGAMRPTASGSTAP